MLLQHLAEPGDDGGHTNAAPDGVGIEGTSIGIVALTRLLGRLVQIDHNGQSRHDEQEEHHPELLDALAATSQHLPEQTDETQYERHTVEHIVAFVLLQLIGQ